MTQTLPSNKSRILLVEGPEDKEFFIKLARHLELPDNIHIIEYKGKDQIDKTLTTISIDPIFAKLRHIGIVRDADYGTNAFDSVCSAIERVNRNAGTTFALPKQPSIPFGDVLKISVLILPINTEGMLEDVILSAYQNDSVMPCVDQFIACIQEQGIIPIRENVPKTRMNLFISGKNLDAEQSTGADRRRRYLSDIFDMTWWTPDVWQHPTFDTIKAYLQQLVQL